MFTPSALKRVLFFLLFDIILSLASIFLAYNLRFNFNIPFDFFDNFFLVFSFLIILKILAINYFRLYNVSWRFFSLYEGKKLLYAHMVAYTLFVIIYYVFPETFNPFPRSIIIIDLFLSLIFIGVLRISKRLIVEGGNNTNLKRTLIVGVSPFAQTLLKHKNEFYVSAIIDDSDMVVNSYFSNMKVGKFSDLEEIVKNDQIESVIITKELKQKVLKSLYSRLKDLDILDIKIVTLSKKEEKTLKSISVEDLLARHPKDLDKEKIASFINGKKVLITGAGGSIGSQISRECIKFGASQLILLDHSEYNLYQITGELEKHNIASVMQSVVNKDSLDRTFAKFKPDIVIHAAAYKHVPLCEENISEAIQNNIIGTKNTIDISIKHNVEKFVLISTDKAVRPTNIMGTTKRICEIYASNVDSKNTEITAVRFGNVLGSSGSVIPKFRSQIEEGKNITVTHPEITRYFMLIPEACELVLQAASIARGGELFILDMGEPVKIVDLARKMIEISGRDDIEIEFTGLRPGEKLYEELLIDDSDKTTQYESITVASFTKYDIDKLNLDIENLIKNDDKISLLKKIVPEFNHQLN
jgi:UDP-N-acetyl-D-glucosamine 4,6-dehydratase